MAQPSQEYIRALDCICPNIQQALNDIAGQNAPALRKDKFGMLEFLTSDLNTSGFEQIKVDTRNGKLHQVNINWAQRFCEDDVTSCTDDCTTGIEALPHCDTVHVTNCLEIKLLFDEWHIRLLCEPLAPTQQKWVADTVMNAINAEMIKLDKAAITAMLANKGSFMNGATLKQIQLWNKFGQNADSPRALAMSRILDEFNQQGLSGMPAIVGANQISLYNKALGYGCCNDYGTDLSRVAGDTMFFYDRFLEGIYGTDHFGVFAPRAAQLLLWNANVGEYAKSNDIFSHETLVNPFMPGITFDFEKYYDPCAKKLVVKLIVYYGFWTMPDDGFSSCDELHGKNGILDYLICDELTDCSTSGSDSEIVLN